MTKGKEGTCTQEAGLSVMGSIQYTNQRVLFFTRACLRILHQWRRDLYWCIVFPLNNRAVAFLIIWYHERGRLNYIVTKNK